MDGASALRRSFSIWRLRVLPALEVLVLAVGWPVGQGQKTVTTDYAREHPLFGSVLPGRWTRQTIKLCLAVMKNRVRRRCRIPGCLAYWLDQDCTIAMLSQCTVMRCSCSRCPHVQAAATMANNSCH